MKGSFDKVWCVAVCCSVLQCVAVCCSVLQCVDKVWSSFRDVPLEGSVDDLFILYRVCWTIYRALLTIYRSLLTIYRTLFRTYLCKAVLMCIHTYIYVYIRLFQHDIGLFLTMYRAVFDII